MLDSPRQKSLRRTHANDISVPPKERAFPVTLVSDDVVAQRAYKKFIERGSIHGFDREDWAEAQRELIAEATTQ